MIVYKVTNNVNGKIYIGKTSKTLEERRNIHIKDSKYLNRVFSNAIKKYGLDNFTWEVIEKCYFEDDLNLAEEWYIRKFNSHAIYGYGYNLTYGGEGSIGRVIDNKTKRKISESNKGRIAWNKGLSKEDDERILFYSSKLIGKKHDDIRKKNQSKARLKWISNNKNKVLSHWKNNLMSHDVRQKANENRIKNGLLKKEKNPRYIKIDENKFVKLYNNGNRLVDIANFFNVGIGTVRRRVKYFGLEKRKRNEIC